MDAVEPLLAIAAVATVALVVLAALMAAALWGAALCMVAFWPPNGETPRAAARGTPKDRPSQA